MLALKEELYVFLNKLNPHENNQDVVDRLFQTPYFIVLASKITSSDKFRCKLFEAINFVVEETETIIYFDDDELVILSIFTDLLETANCEFEDQYEFEIFIVSLTHSKLKITVCYCCDSDKNGDTCSSLTIKKI